MNFGDSIITMFILLTSENINSVIHMYISTNGWGSSIYFVTNVLLGNTMLLNLFLGVLLNSIQDSIEMENQAIRDKEEIEIAEDSFEKQLQDIQERLREKHLIKQSTKSKKNLSINAQEKDEKPGLDRNDASLPQVKIEDINSHLKETKKITEKSHEDGS